MIMVAALLLTAAPPLSDAQRTMLEATTDRSRSIDEAGLYALMQNAERWPEPQEAEAGARVPDYGALRTEPAAHRGERFLIEGTLEAFTEPATYTARPNRPLSRPGYESAKVWLLSREDAGVMLVVLTDPPALEPVGGRDRLRKPARVGARVRLPARFYKLLASESREGPGVYPVFVGRSARFTGAAADGGTSAWFVSGGALFLVVVLLVAYGAVRYLASKSGKRQTRRRYAEEEEPEVDRRDDLPEDPAEAMRVLSTEHDAEALDASPLREPDRRVASGSDPPATAGSNGRPS